MSSALLSLKNSKLLKGRLGCEMASLHTFFYYSEESFNLQTLVN